MNSTKSMWEFWVKLGCYVSFNLRWYYIWSKLYRFLFEQKFKKTPITTVFTLDDVERRLLKLKWTADSWRQLWDAISSPQRVEVTYANPAAKRKYGNDCDEFSSYAAALLRQLPGYADIGLLSIVWDSTGHNVCVFRRKESMEWSYIGNWYGGRAQHGFNSIEEIVKHVVLQANGKALMGWGLATPDLNYISSKVYW